MGDEAVPAIVQEEEPVAEPTPEPTTVPATTNPTPKRSFTVNAQQTSSIIRQVAAIAAIVMGALTSALSGIKLPPAVSTVLVAAGGVLLAIEHFVGDTSTGSSTPQ